MMKRRGWGGNVLTLKTVVNMLKVNFLCFYWLESYRGPLEIICSNFILETELSARDCVWGPDGQFSVLSRSLNTPLPCPSMKVAPKGPGSADYHGVLLVQNIFICVFCHFPLSLSFRPFSGGKCPANHWTLSAERAEEARSKEVQLSSSKPGSHLFMPHR